jgi:hypothetical protein
MDIYRNFVKKMKSILPARIFTILMFVKNIPLNIMSLYLGGEYSILNKYGKNYGITRRKRRVPIIMSGTTFPARINKVHLAIETILRQSVKPDYIYLWLTYEEFPNGKRLLPRKLLDLEKRGLKIKFIVNNLRSNNKLVHTLEENDDVIIITFDDDCFYAKNHILGLYKIHKKFPKDIVGYDSMQIKVNKNGRPLPYSEWFNYSKNKIVGHEVFLLNVNGILYPPKSLSREIFNYEILKKKSLYGDDIWFKAMALLQGTMHRRVYRSNKVYPTILNTQQISLNNINVHENRNDKMIKDVFKEYNLYRFFKG